MSYRGRKKVRHQHKKFLAEEHHRRPHSLKGRKDRVNISLVRPESHDLWHQLFGNLNAYQICDKINDSQIRPKKVTLICRLMNNGHRVEMTGCSYGTRNQAAFMFAWRGLFGGLSFHESVDFINSVWLDPSYRLYIIKKK